MDAAQREDLQFLPWLSEEQQRESLQQLEQAYVLHGEQLSALEAERAGCLDRNEARHAQALTDRIEASRDAVRRTQSVERMIKYGHRIRGDLMRDATSGQFRQPPRLAACLDGSSGLFQAFVIYELRSSSTQRLPKTPRTDRGPSSSASDATSSDAASSDAASTVAASTVASSDAGSSSSDAGSSSSATLSPPASPLIASAGGGASDSEGSASEGESSGLVWHLFINDVFSMRQLLPMQSCWREGVGSMLIALLQSKSEAKHRVVVLKALCEAPGLGDYYERIGFSSCEAAFESEGLSPYYFDGEMVRR